MPVPNHRTALLRLLLVSAAVILPLVLIGRAVTAHNPSPAHPLPAAQTDDPAFDRYLTVTIESGDLLTPALSSRWVHAIYSVPIPAQASFPILVPPDSTEITATVDNGEFSIVDATIQFTLYQGVSSYGWSYRTAQAVTRQGNQYNIAQRATNNLYPFHYDSTIVFSAPLEYVGTLGRAPTTVTSDTIHWSIDSDYFPEIYTVPHRLQLTTYLVDPRLAQPDLSFTSHALQLEAAGASFIAHLTATLYNGGSMAAGAPTYLNVYDRLSTTTVPTGPLDLEAGWCSGAPYYTCPSTAAFPNPVAQIEAGQSLTLTADYIFTATGLHHFYLQADVFGGPIGLNAESDETNNLIDLGEVRTARLFLPLIHR